MIKSKEILENRGVEVDLNGPEGNAFVLMGYVKGWCRDLGKESQPILEEMQSGNYEHLLDVMEREFGDVVTFYR